MGRIKKIVIEEWKPINGFNGDFEISRSGLVRQNNIKKVVKSGTAILVKNIGTALIPRCNLSQGVYSCKYKGSNVDINIRKAYSELFPDELNPFERKKRLRKVLNDYIKKDKNISKHIINTIINSNPFSEALNSILDSWDDLSIQEIKERLLWVAESAYVKHFNISELKEKVISKIEDVKPKELWKPVKETNGRYFVSNTGKMKSVLNGIERFVGAKCGWTKTPYVTYYVDGKKINIQVAKVILKTFTGIEGKRIHFKDGDQTNLRLDNMEWKV